MTLETLQLRGPVVARRRSVGSLLALPVADLLTMLGCFGVAGLINLSYQNVTEERTLILALLISACLVLFHHFGHYSRRRQLWQEFGDPEPEIGWVLTLEAEGNGYASEAAAAILPHAMALFGAGGVVSYIDADNHRSARVAEKLGARRDPAAEAALQEDDLHIYRHFGPEDRA